MKKITLIILFCTNSLFSQVVYQASNDSDFKAMVSDGIKFLPSLFTNRDSIYINAFKENWKISEFKVFDPENDKLYEDDIVVAETYMTTGEHILAWIKVEEISKKSDKKTSKYACIGYFCLNGFSSSDDSQSIARYANLIVKGFNDTAEIVLQEKIIKNGSGLYKAVFEKTLPKSQVLKTKTLLINQSIVNYIDLKALEKKGIKYKVISSQQFDAMPAAERAQCCLMYFAYNSYTEISIFDLENNQLVYTRHFAGAKNKFSGSDIDDIVRIWQ